MPIDALDAAHRRAARRRAADRRAGGSRRLGVARGTVQARLDRLDGAGVISGLGPELDPAALGYRGDAFVTLEIRQGGGHDAVARPPGARSPRCWRRTPSPAPGDLWCRIVARSNADLQRVIDTVVATPGHRAHGSTMIALATRSRTACCLWSPPPRSDVAGGSLSG